MRPKQVLPKRHVGDRSVRGDNALALVEEAFKSMMDPRTSIVLTMDEEATLGGPGEIIAQGYRRSGWTERLVAYEVV